MAKLKADGSSEQSIEELQKRYQKLNERKIASETELKGALKRLEELKKEAREQYGTDDAAELQRKLEEMKRDNEEKRAAYQAALDRIESDLAQVEQKFTATEG